MSESPHATHIVRVARVAVTVGLCLCIGALGACGSSPAKKLVTYSDPAHGFSITYDKSRSYKELAPPQQSEPGIVSQIHFFDGIAETGDPLSAFGVVVRAGNGATPDAAQLATLAKVLTKRLQPTQGARFGAYKVSRLGDYPCLEISSTFVNPTSQKKGMARDFLVFEPAYVYQIHIQSLSDSWAAEQPYLMSVAESFKVLPAGLVSTPAGSSPGSAPVPSP